LENILVNQVGLDRVDKCKIADLGISVVAEQAYQPVEMQPCGTKGYMAPEVSSGRYSPLQQDIYSFGIICLSLICGVHDPNALSAADGNTVSFALNDQGQGLVETDEDFSWLHTEIHRSCAAKDSARRPTASKTMSLLEGRCTQDVADS
jgi:serine/threonine protein kinase